MNKAVMTNMQVLLPYTLLQGGKYRIERVLGQGGFGITYLATQVVLNRLVAIKEFFMKDYCAYLYLSILLVLSPILPAWGQASGGAIQRPTKKPSKTITAPTKSNKIQSKIESSNTYNEIPDVIKQLEKDMVFVEGGTFIMGATSEQGRDAFDNEKPAHEVTLSSFHICKHEVTQEEWEVVMGSNPSYSYFKGPRRPVDNVSWNDCQVFINKLNKLMGKSYRLPTEAEWEYAARGGKKSQNLKYSGSNSISGVAWYIDNSYSRGVNSPDYGTHVVMSKQANELGLYDMSGNVWEWCSDWYGEDYYSFSSSSNPQGPSSGSNRVSRGGSWFSNAMCCRVSNRHSNTPSDSYNFLGFRLAQ